MSSPNSAGGYKVWADGVGANILAWAEPHAGDSPTKAYPLASFSTALGIVFVYLVFVFVGASIMKTFPEDFQKRGFAPSLYPIRFIYNIVQVVLCSYMALEAGIIAWREGYTLMPCVPFNVENPPIGKVLWLFYISKILDFMDTFFIIMGCNWRQLSFLHVYHHATIFLFYWLNLHVNYDGDIYLTIVLNGLIHAMMYTYYFVSLHTKDIWWKSFLTLGQMFQFCVMITQAIVLVVGGCDGGAPRKVTQLYCVYIMTLLFLFAQFFNASYVKKEKKKTS
jgi:elongation of very long chain fatty acids protein 4